MSESAIVVGGPVRPRPQGAPGVLVAGPGELATALEFLEPQAEGD